jgi:nucleoside 2-deoxyribosyltransferase
LIYLASPYTHDSIDVMNERFEKVCRAAADLMQSGELVYSPIAHGHAIAVQNELPVQWEYWRDNCIWFIERCSEVVILTLDGWRNSTGVQAEIEIAKSHGKPVRLMTEDLQFDMRGDF